VQVDIGLDHGSPEAPIEDRARRLQPHALVGAVEWLGQPFDRTA
jgi:hypothetical protein